MKIVIPVENKDMGEKVCISFGRAPYFLVYDIETKEKIFKVNSAVTSPGGAGIKAAQIIIDNKGDVVLTPRCGENAANVLKAAGIKLFKTINASIKENIDAFIDGKLLPLNDIHGGFHGHGGN